MSRRDSPDVLSDVVLVVGVFVLVVLPLAMCAMTVRNVAVDAKSEAPGQPAEAPSVGDCTAGGDL